MQPCCAIHEAQSKGQRCLAQIVHSACCTSTGTVIVSVFSGSLSWFIFVPSLPLVIACVAYQVVVLGIITLTRAPEPKLRSLTWADIWQSLPRRLRLCESCNVSGFLEDRVLKGCTGADDAGLFRSSGPRALASFAGRAPARCTSRRVGSRASWKRASCYQRHAKLAPDAASPAGGCQVPQLWKTGIPEFDNERGPRFRDGRNF